MTDERIDALIRRLDVTVSIRIRSSRDRPMRRSCRERVPHASSDATSDRSPRCATCV